MPLHSQFQNLLDEINHRDAITLSELSKGDYFKLGSCCYQVTKTTRARVFAEMIDATGKITPGHKFPLHSSTIYRVIRLSALDVYSAIRLHALENIQPFDPFAGLSAAVGVYLEAEKRMTNS